MSRFPLRGVFLFSVALTLGFSWGAGAILDAQKPPVMFASIVDPNGTPITDLKNFKVSLRVGLNPCASARLEPIDWPMKLQVLIDNGAAMAGSLPALKNALRAFLDELPEGIETSLVTYSPQPQVVVQPTTDPRKVAQGVDQLSATSSHAAFIQAASEATTRVARSRGNFFHTVMVVTTNGPEESKGSVEGMVARMREQLPTRLVTAHVLMLALSEQQVLGTVAGAEQTQTGNMLASVTRGTYESVTSPTRLPAAMREFGRKIARSHLLQTHQFRVSCDRPPSKSARMMLSVQGPVDVNLILTPDGLIP